MKPKILLTGKNGQVGAELSALLPQLGELVALGRDQLDLTSPSEIRRIIQESRPQLIVNAAAYTAVDQAEKETKIAHAINADAPAVMAEEAKKIGAILVHYSTDYVFDGSKRSPYSEDDPTNPLSVYGQTKLAGEQSIVAVGAPHLIFRTAWVYDTRGRNFLLTILRLASQREELRIVSDQIGAPTASREIAYATSKILTQIWKKGGDTSGFSECSGIYHMTAGGKTNWYQFAESILQEVKKTPQDSPWLAAATNGRPIITQRVIPITTAEYPTPASRPAYSVLSNSRLQSRFGFQLPEWHEQLKQAFRNAS